MLTILSLSHRQAPLPVRARFALGPERQARLYRTIARTCGGQALFLSTCNRVEVIAWTGAARRSESVGIIQRVGARLFPDLTDEFLLHAAVLADDQAAIHLLRVAGGLDSQVPGDVQVLGQLRTAYLEASVAGAIGAELHRLLQTALRAGKRIHRETELGGANATVGRAAAHLLLRRFPPAGPAPRVAVIGAGQAGAAAAEALVDGGARVVLLNRSGARAERLARRIGAEAADFDSRHAVVSGVDGVILATSAGTPVITAESLAPERLRKRREGCWLTMFDLSVPLNTDPAVRHLPNVELLTLDDLPGTAAGSRSPSAEAIIADEARYFRNWLSSRRLNRASVA